MGSAFRLVNAEIKAATIDAMQLDRWVMQGKNVLISMPHIDFFIESHTKERENKNEIYS